MSSYKKNNFFITVFFLYIFDFDLISGRYVIDAKSIMGIFSLDLSKPIDLTIHTDEDTTEVMDGKIDRLREV